MSDDDTTTDADAIYAAALHLALDALGDDDPVDLAEMTRRLQIAKTHFEVAMQLLKQKG